jgi:hypothetical protein
MSSARLRHTHDMGNRVTIIIDREHVFKKNVRYRYYVSRNLPGKSTQVW